MDVVLSGMRRDATILVWVDVRKSAKAGVKWWRSANGVVLTDGLDRKLGLEWVAWVERRGTGEVLFGTKPPGGAAAFGLDSGDEEGEVIFEGGGGGDGTENGFEADIRGLKVGGPTNGSIASAEDDRTELLKDNWDD